MKETKLPIQSLIENIDLSKLKSLEDFPERNITELEILKEFKSYTTRYSEENAIGCGDPFPTEFTHFICSKLKENEKMLEFLREECKGKVFVDLGAGRNSQGYSLANLLEAKAYIGNELHFFQELNEVLGDHESKIPYSIVPDHMLNFLESVPDGELELIYTRGIDNLLTHHSYREAVDKEIIRVLSPDGIYLSFQSNILEDKVKFWNIQEKDPFMIYDLKIYKKNE